MFNLQLFGDNDTLKTDDSLIMEYKHTSGTDNFKLEVPNPHDNLTESVIRNSMSYQIAQGIFIDPKTGTERRTSNGYSVFSAYRKTVTTMDLDLSDL